MGIIATQDGDKDGATALWITAAGRAELRRGGAGLPGTADCRVRTLFGAVSRGTERLVFAGLVPPSEHERMRAPLQEGAFTFPVKYGYSAVGVVESGPEPLRGRTVFCLHPHQDRFRAPPEMLHVVPDEVPPERAVLAPFMETALNTLWDARVEPGDRVGVIGAGLVGCLVATLAARVPGTEVVLVDPSAARRAYLSGWPCAAVAPEDAPSDCDVVIHASGHPSGVTVALGCAGFEARVVEASWFGAAPVEMPLGGAFHARRLEIVSSQVSHVPAHRRARWTTRRRLEKALSLLADPALDQLFSGETPFERLDRDYASILADPGTLCHRIRYPA
ncbi:zinc-binding alcohol dehydrogenase [Aureimonas sp. AU4]|uniref:zinc-dependent alcohol dehydrogenase n=1 Tax=Aureimonas sp. AU4 TaxID=1638163 RepID=UPI000783BF25|nr:zinc-binding alcohol dehydrogenase [Aureimonas sp. AU4]